MNYKSKNDEFRNVVTDHRKYKKRKEEKIKYGKRK
jgi:hypothetical protein